MWRTPKQRQDSARARLALAAKLWGWRPHDQQKLFFTSPAQVRVAACGRRWGKTEALSLDLATLALHEAQQGRECRQLVVAPTDAQARLIGGETLARLREAFEARTPRTHGLRLNERQRPALQLTVFPTGSDPQISNDKKGHGPAISRILFRTAGQDGRGLRGLWAHRIVLDEAGYIPDQVISEVLLPMLTDVGGDLVMASSPAGRRSAFYRMFARGMAEGDPCCHRGDPSRQQAGFPPRNGEGEEITYASFQCPSTDNPHINAAFLQAMAEELGESRFAQEYGAQFVDDYGAVFRADDIDGCLAEDPGVTGDNGNLVSQPQPDHFYSVGVDWGRKRDFTVVCVLDGTARPARLVGLWRMQGMGWETQAARVGEIVAAFGPLKVLADGNSIGDPLAEQLQEAIWKCVPDGERIPQVERFLFAGESKTRLVDHLTVGLSARALTYPSHAVLLAELRGFEYQGETSSGRHRMAAAGSGHDDTVMALALAWYGAPQGTPPPPASLLLLGSSLGIGRAGS